MSSVGNDVVQTEFGDDEISGGPGSDTLRSGACSDMIEDGPGNDLIAGWNSQSNEPDLVYYLGTSTEFTITPDVNDGSWTVTGKANQAYFTIIHASQTGSFGIKFFKFFYSSETWYF